MREGNADVGRRSRIRRPQMRTTQLFGRGPPRLYRGGFGRRPMSRNKQIGGRVEGGRQGARSSGRLNGGSLIDGFRCGGRCVSYI